MGRYWDHDGPNQKAYERLQVLVPVNGPAQTLEGELLRAAGVLGYEAYNNGFGANNRSGALLFLKENLPGFKEEWSVALLPYVFGDDTRPDDYEPCYEACEAIVDAAVMHVDGRAGIYLPSPGDYLEWTAQPGSQTNEHDVDTPSISR